MPITKLKKSINNEQIRKYFKNKEKNIDPSISELRSLLILKHQVMQSHQLQSTKCYYQMQKDASHEIESYGVRCNNQVFICLKMLIRLEQTMHVIQQKVWALKFCATTWLHSIVIVLSNIWIHGAQVCHKNYRLHLISSLSWRKTHWILKWRSRGFLIMFRLGGRLTSLSRINILFAPSFFLTFRGLRHKGLILISIKTSNCTI